MQNDQSEPERHNAQIGHMTTRQVAALFGVSTSTIRRNARRLGRKPFGRWQIDPAAVDAITQDGPE